MSLVALLALGLVANMKFNFLKVDFLVFHTRVELVKAVVIVLIAWVVFLTVGQYVIKPKYYFCGRCNGKLKSNKKGSCPHCGVEVG